MNPDRLSGLDASFLHLERGGAHMHVGSCLRFEGDAPAYDELLAQLERRLHLVPRYRQKLATVPFGAANPVWVDDPHFNAGYHVRHTALPPPAGTAELRRLAGRVLSQQLDRSKPLWEIWLVDRVGDDGFAIVSKTHHALVDGISGVDVASVLLDLEPDPPDAAENDHPWIARPEPAPSALLADALAERAAAPVEALRAATGSLADPPAAAARAAGAALGVGSLLAAGVTGRAPASPLNAPIGPHRRFTWVAARLGRFKAIKSALAGTVNDAVLTVVAGALRDWYLANGHPTEDVVLKAMVPVSVRAIAERGALGNRVATMYASLPLHTVDPVERFRLIHDEMAGLKESGQAVGAEVLTRLAGFAPPTVLAQAGRLQTRQRFFNLTVTNVPGPQFPLYLLGRRLTAIHPAVPLARNVRLGIAVVSYDGGIGFGLLADYDGLPDLERIAGGLERSIDELADAVGAGASTSRRADAVRA